MRLKKTLIFLLILLFILQLCSCSPEKRQLRKEKKELASYILSNLDNDEIKFVETNYFGPNSMYITLYGSDKAEDILDLITICDEWINNNQDSYAVSERVPITVELYLKKPVKSGHNDYDYVVSISNYYDSPILASSAAFDCIDINSCASLQSSDFRSLLDHCRYISLPSTVEIDDFEVFIDMTELEYIMISDSPFEVDHQRVIDKYNEIMEIASDYPDLQFEIYYLSAVLD